MSNILNHQSEPCSKIFDLVILHLSWNPVTSSYFDMCGADKNKEENVLQILVEIAMIKFKILLWKWVISNLAQKLNK